MLEHSKRPLLKNRFLDAVKALEGPPWSNLFNHRPCEAHCALCADSADWTRLTDDVKS